MQFEANVMFNGTRFDFRLEDGTLLHKSEWNGEFTPLSCRTVANGCANRSMPRLETTSRSWTLMFKTGNSTTMQRLFTNAKRKNRPAETGRQKLKGVFTYDT